ncbi:MAG: hypothetical protein ABIZ80_21945, partial [Bryobacteraceae bacterium]
MPDVTRPSRAAAQRILENLPLWFESNEGQMAPEVRYYSRTAGYALFLTSREAVLTLSPREAGGTPRVLRMSLPGAARSAEVEGVEPLPARSSHILGNDPSRWRKNTPHYSRVRYRSVFNGIDLVYRGSGSRLEYDFIVAPGADPRAIRMKFSGAERVYLDDDGTLVLSIGGDQLRQPKPTVYQQDGDSRTVVPGRYELHRGGEVRFAVGNYDRNQTLVIDPELVYSTYLGGDGIAQGAALAVDPSGNLWLAGQVASGAFPTAGDPLQTSRNGSQDIFLAKIDPTKAGPAALVYSTFYGGTGSDTVQDITTDLVGNVY